MIIDPIVEQLHKEREEYMERFHYDLDAVVRDIKAREAANPAPILQPPSAPSDSQRTRYSRR